MKRVNFTQKFKIELLVPRCRATLGELNGTFDVALALTLPELFSLKTHPP